MDPIEQLIEWRRPHGLSPLARRFFRLHQLNPDLLDFFTQELVTLRANGWERTSFGSLWHHARWVFTTRRAPGETFAMSQNLACHYARALIILHPEFNGFYALEKALADKDFGVCIEPAPRKYVAGYVRRLYWADGRAIENGWRPTVAHKIPSAPVPRRKPVERAHGS